MQERLIFVTDGAKWISNWTVRRAIDAEYPQATQILDRPATRFFHAKEHLGEFASVYFKANNFAKGDPLPKEIELAEYLGVSRNIVREALSRLRMMGMIDSKKRKGMVIAEPDLLSGVRRMLDPGILSEEAMQNIFELRLVLEIGMADLLFTRLIPEDIDELQDIAEKEASDRKTTSLKVRLQYEIEFHSKLYAMSGNDTLRRFQKMLLPVFNYMMEEESKLEKKPESGRISHFDLVETLKNGAPEQFRENMREHLAPHFNKL